MTDWTKDAPGLEKLDDASQQKLSQLKPIILPAGHVLFRPGDTVAGFVIALSGRVGVYLTGANGRELLLYAVTPGETCVQTTLGLLGEQHYTGEAIAETDVSAVMVPPALFQELMAQSDTFRRFVFRAFAERLQTVMQVLEKIAFVAIEARLAQCLLDRMENLQVHATHSELATMIGTSREVVSRRLLHLAGLGIISQDRGVIDIANRDALSQRAAQ